MCLCSAYGLCVCLFFCSTVLVCTVIVKKVCQTRSEGVNHEQGIVISNIKVIYHPCGFFDVWLHHDIKYIIIDKSLIITIHQLLNHYYFEVIFYQSCYYDNSTFFTKTTDKVSTKS